MLDKSEAIVVAIVAEVSEGVGSFIVLVESVLVFF